MFCVTRAPAIGGPICFDNQQCVSQAKQPRQCGRVLHTYLLHTQDLGILLCRQGTNITTPFTTEDLWYYGSNYTLHEDSDIFQASHVTSLAA